MPLHCLGDKALVLELDGGIDEGMLERVRGIVAGISDAAIAGVTDVVAGYASVTVHFEPAAIRGAALRALLEPLVALADGPGVPRTSERPPTSNRPRTSDGPPTSDRPRTVEISVHYGGTDGPDLAALAARCGLEPPEVVALHTGATYIVHMIGFVPGFPYLGGLDPRLATPRRATPRTAVPAGSVGIGGAQTGVYPIESPGGWHLIGRTALSLFDAARTEPALLRVGDRVRFVDVGAR